MTEVAAVTLFIVTGEKTMIQAGKMGNCINITMNSIVKITINNAKFLFFQNNLSFLSFVKYCFSILKRSLNQNLFLRKSKSN